MKYWSSPETNSLNREPMLSLKHEESLSLDGIWAFQLLKSPDLVPTSNWSEIAVPGLWTMQPESDVFWDKPIYTNIQMPFDELPPCVPELNPTGIYERDFTIPDHWKGERFVIQIGGFESVAILSINGTEVGMAKDSRLASEFDITKFLKAGSNRIQIKVVKWSDATFIEDQDQWWHGGITRSVVLYATPNTYLQRFYLTPGLERDLKTGTLKARGYIASTTGAYPAGYSVSLDVEGVAGSKECTIPNVEKTESILEDFAGWSDDIKSWFGSEFWDNKLPASLAKAAETYRPTQLGEILIEKKYKVKAWSPESPNLYFIRISLKDPNGKIVQSFIERTGFRDTRVVGHQYLFNYQPVIIYGINRHDFHPDTGRVLTREYIREDLLALKAFNFNAIRTSHYPNDPALLELADELGFYVVGEANIESHAFQDSLCDDPRYLSAFVERCARMAQRDISHPSVIFWSLGNEAGSGPNQSAAAALLRNFDPSRPLHYEGAIRNTRFLTGFDQTDLVCPMYPSIKAIVRYAKSPKRNRPLIMCEYSHAMGNSNGTLKEYWDAIHTYEGLQGGFIWEFWDHAINQVLPDGRIRSAYGGDFGETRHDGSFVCDGMFWADRTPKPAMYEMKLIASPIDVLSANPDSLKFTVHNKLFFTDTSNYELKWQLTVEGDVVEEGHIKLGKIDPRGKKAIALQFKKMKYSGEKLITFTVARKGATAWANAGAPIGEFQFKLASQPREELSKKSSPALESLVSKDGDILLPYGKKAPQLTLFRAPTENDIYGHIAPKWRKWGLRELTQKSIKTELGKNKAEISRIWETSTGIKVHHHQRIKVIPGGFKVSEEITIPKSLDDLPRVGITFEIDSALEDFTYFGSGPVETYPDRNMSPIRKVVSTVNDQYIPYVVPQESGGHSSVRWFELSNEFGEKIRIEFNNPLQVSALPYSAAEFDSKSHDIDLVKSENTVVTIDAIHRGVGTASCGPDTLPRYLIKPGVYKFSWTFTVVSN